MLKVHRLLGMSFGGTERILLHWLPLMEDMTIDILNILNLAPPFSSWKTGTELLLQTVVTVCEKTTDGNIIEAVALPWLAILAEIEKNPDFLHQFAKHSRKFEEFLAATYSRAGWPEVVLTPRTNDRGRDVIATKPGFGSIRILDQAKAFSPGRLVTHNDVRTMLGVLQTDLNTSKGIITTTSDFAPGVTKGDEFKKFMPHRLELKNGNQLREWLMHVKMKNA